MWIVYRIKVDGVIRYIGITGDIVRRKGEHIRGVKKGKGKELYVKCFNLERPNIEIEVIREFDKISEAKRWEAFLILGDWFGKKNLWQSPPGQIKYF